jgi:hypothetical protein
MISCDYCDIITLVAKTFTRWLKPRRTAFPKALYSERNIHRVSSGRNYRLNYRLVGVPEIAALPKIRSFGLCTVRLTGSKPIILKEGPEPFVIGRKECQNYLLRTV